MPQRQPQPPRRDRFPRQHGRPRREEGREAGRPAGVWLYGTHAVLAAVANPLRRIRRLIAAEAALQKLQAAAKGATAMTGTTGARPVVEAADRKGLDAVLPPGAVHQGMAALVEPLPELALEDLLDRVKAEAGARLVVLDQATDPRNVGAVIRSAAAFSAVAVLTQDRHAPAATGALAKAAAGSLERVPLIGVVNLARALRTLQAAGFWCVGLDGGGEDDAVREPAGGARGARPRLRGPRPAPAGPRGLRRFGPHPDRPRQRQPQPLGCRRHRPLRTRPQPGRRGMTRARGSTRPDGNAPSRRRRS